MAENGLMGDAAIKEIKVRLQRKKEMGGGIWGSHGLAKPTDGGEGGGRKPIQCGESCTISLWAFISITKGFGEDGDGDCDCVSAHRAYGLGGQHGDNTS